MLADAMQQALDLVRDNRAWATPIVFAISLGESLAFVSFLVPATVILIGVGALINAGTLQFLPIWAAATVGGCLGYWISFVVGQRLGPEALRRWPVNRHPHTVARAEAFFHRHGALSVFAGHFFSPVRGVIPLVAGILGMRTLPFQIANVTSAALWAYLVLLSGDLGGDAIGRLRDTLGR